MCSPGLAQAGLMVASSVYTYGQQTRAYNEAMKARQQNKESAEDELQFT